MEIDEFFSKQNTIHIRIIQSKRNMRKFITLIENIEDKYDKKHLLAVLKKELNTGGSVKNYEGKEVIMIQGDERRNLNDILTTMGFGNIELHGF